MFGVEEIKRGTYRFFEDKAEAEVEDEQCVDCGRDEDGVGKDDCLDWGWVCEEADCSEAGVCLEVEGEREEAEWKDDVLYDDADWKEEEDRDKLSLFMLFSRFRFKEF